MSEIVRDVSLESLTWANEDNLVAGLVACGQGVGTAVTLAPLLDVRMQPVCRLPGLRAHIGFSEQFRYDADLWRPE